MDNFIVESMMFEHQIQCEIDQCFIEMHEYIFDENADIMLEEAQNKKEGIIDKLIKRINEFIQKVKDWFSKLTKNEGTINKKIEKVEEAIEQNPEIGNQRTENIDIPKLVDEAISESKKGNNKKSIKDILLIATPVAVTIAGVIVWVKSGINKKAIKRLQTELDKTKKELEKAEREAGKAKFDLKVVNHITGFDLKVADHRAKAAREENDILKNENNELNYKLKDSHDKTKVAREENDRLKNENNKLNYKLKDSQQRAGKRIREQNEKIENMNDALTKSNLQVALLTQALTVATQEANKQIQVATTGKPSTTTTKHSGENTAPSTKGSPKTKEEKNEAEHLSQEEQAKRIYIKHLDTIVKVWGNGATRKDVTNFANSVKSENEALDKLKNINPKPSNPDRIPEMIMTLKRKGSEYIELTNGTSRKKS